MRIRPVLVTAAATGALLAGLAAARAPALPDFIAAYDARARVPEEALVALQQGRHYRAYRILETHLGSIPDTTPAEVLLTARAAAGWKDWPRVVELLRGPGWLDAENSGEGWWLIGRAHEATGRLEDAANAYARYVHVAGEATGRDVGLAWIRRGEVLRRIERVPDALESYDRAAALLPDIAPWIAFSAAEAVAAAGDTAELSRRLARVEPQIAQEWGWALRVDAIRNAGDPIRARAVARSAAESLRSSTRRAQAWGTVAELAMEAGETDAARDAWRQAMNAAPGAVAGVDAARNLSELGGLSPTDRLEIGRVYLRHGNYDRAVDGIEAYLAAGRPGPAERERLRLQLAHALFSGRRYDAAERQFLAIAENASSSGIAAEALFYAGRSQYRDGRTTEGRRTFDRVASRYPGQAGAARALYIEADLAQDDGNTQAARTGFRRAVESGVGVEEVGFAAMRLGGMAMAEGDFEQAIREFEEYRRRWPQGRRWAQATYWSAIANEKLGRDDRARALFREVRRVEPISYYGGQAAIRLGEPILGFPMRAAPPEDAAARTAVEDALARYDLLRELGWDDAAAFELDRIRSRFTGRDNTAYALAEALNERGLATTGIALGWDLFRRGGGWNPRLLRVIYPFPFRTLVVAEATDLGVNPFLAAGLIRQESMFLPTARSGANAWGLMQVLPETGEQIARAIDMPLFTDDMLTLPEINVMLGMRYLADQLETWDGRLPLVLGAYNAGPHRVRRWQEFPEITDDELFAERIPFEETREYVKIVQQNARIYAELWTE